MGCEWVEEPVILDQTARAEGWRNFRMNAFVHRSDLGADSL